MEDILAIIKKALNENIIQKGKILELVACDILEDLGFSHIRRQLAGSQYGFDILATITSEHDGKPEIWKFECKNLSSSLTINDLAPKLIWHKGQTTFDKFVIISVSPLSNDVYHLLEDHSLSMPIEVWETNSLFKKILQSPKALKRLNIHFTNKIEFQQEIITPFFLPRQITLDVVHTLDPPFSFDYLYQGNEIIKAYNDYNFNLLAIIANHTKTSDFFINNFSIITNSYEKNNGRVFRQHKQKGFYEPTKFLFRPSTTPGGEVLLLKDEKYKVPAFTEEGIEFILNDAIPGLYNIQIKINGIIDGKPTVLHSPKFLLHVPSSKKNMLTLNVVGKHYDSVVETILNLEQSTWDKIKALENTAGVTYLGPTIIDVSKGGNTDETWKIRYLPGKKSKTTEGLNSLDISTNTKSAVIHDTGIKIQETIFSQLDAFKNVFNQNKWKKILPNQLGRRIRIRDNK